MKFKLIDYIRNKSLRWRIMACIGIAILILAASLFTTMRLSYFSMQNLGDSYKSNSDLTYFSQAVTTTEKAMENYRQGLKLICSQESYDELQNSGFHVIYRDENRTIEQTVSLAEKAFGLT